MQKYLLLTTTISFTGNGIPFMMQCVKDNPLYDFLDGKSIMTTEYGDRVFTVTMKLKPWYKRMFIKLTNNG